MFFFQNMSRSTCLRSKLKLGNLTFKCLWNKLKLGSWNSNFRIKFNCFSFFFHYVIQKHKFKSSETIYSFFRVSNVVFSGNLITALEKILKENGAINQGKNQDRNKPEEHVGEKICKP